MTKAASFDAHTFSYQFNCVHQIYAVKIAPPMVVFIRHMKKVSPRVSRGFIAEKYPEYTGNVML